MLLWLRQLEDWPGREARIQDTGYRIQDTGYRRQELQNGRFSDFECCCSRFEESLLPDQ
jgi:hypothetical protein